MRVFTALFDLAVMPIVVAKDAVMIIPDLVDGNQIFDRTRNQCKTIDRDLGMPG